MFIRESQAMGFLIRGDSADLVESRGMAENAGLYLHTYFSLKASTDPRSTR